MLRRVSICVQTVAPKTVEQRRVLLKVFWLADCHVTWWLEMHFAVSAAYVNLRARYAGTSAMSLNTARPLSALIPAPVPTRTISASRSQFAAFCALCSCVSRRWFLCCSLPSMLAALSRVSCLSMLLMLVLVLVLCSIGSRFKLKSSRRKKKRASFCSACKKNQLPWLLGTGSLVSPGIRFNKSKENLGLLCFVQSGADV
jgi:hypothetical protein